MMVQRIWWCPMCDRRIRQPRWSTASDRIPRSYHMVGLTLHRIVRIEVVNAEPPDEAPRS